MANKAKQNSKDTSITTTIITVAGTIIVALISFFAVWVQNKPSDLGEVAPPTAFSTEEAAIRQAPSNLIYSNDFDEVSSGWPTEDTNNETITKKQFVSNGTYNWEIIPHGDFASYLYPSDIPALSNFEVSIDIKISGSEISDDSYFCLHIRSSNDNFYCMGIMPIRGISVVHEHEYKDGKDIFSDIAGDGKTFATINQNSFNNLRIVAKGENLTFYINDVLVTDVVDDRLKSGSIGLEVHGDEDILTKFIIDNFQVIQVR
jgi:hypothetical protein